MLATHASISIYFLILYVIGNITMQNYQKKITIYWIHMWYCILNIFFFFLLFHQFRFFIFYEKTEELSIFCGQNNFIGLPLDFSLRIDSLSFYFMCLISFIGTLSNIYTINYFKSEACEKRFFILLNWFIFSMLFLVMANSIISLLLSWELIGITSYLLINFWNNKKKVLISGFKAFFFNKISDLFLLAAMITLYFTYRYNDFNTINKMFLVMSSFDSEINTSNLYYFRFFITISACIKSAQILFHIWLPDSMEAPVPASALIHSATLVSAGVYLLLRFQNFFEYTKINELIYILGSITAMYGGLVTAYQTDLKKLLAYSTISHCGFLFVCCSYHNNFVTITYLMLHGVFKAGTFFCVGYLIKLNNHQDVRFFDNFSHKYMIKAATICMVINLCGLPFTIGFMYKFLLFKEIATYYHPICLGFQMIGMLTSIIYGYRIIFFSFFETNKAKKSIQINYVHNLQYEKADARFNVLTFLCVFLVISVSIVYYYMHVKVILKNLISIGDVFIVENTELTNINLYKFNKNIFVFYYTSSIFIIIAIIMMNGRKIFAIDTKLNFFLKISGFVMFFFIITSIKKTIPTSVIFFKNTIDTIQHWFMIMSKTFYDFLEYCTNNKKKAPKSLQWIIGVFWCSVCIDTNNLKIDNIVFFTISKWVIILSYAWLGLIIQIRILLQKRPRNPDLHWWYDELQVRLGLLSRAYQWDHYVRTTSKYYNPLLEDEKKRIPDLRSYRAYLSLKKYFTDTYWWRTVLVLIFFSIAHFCITYIKNCLNLYMAGTKSAFWNSLVNLSLHISINLEILVWILNGILIYLLIERLKHYAISKRFTELRLKIIKVFSLIKQKYYHAFTKNYLKISIKEYFTNTYWWRTVLVLIFYSIAHFCITYIKNCINLYMAGTESAHWNSLVNLCLHISINFEILVWILNGILIYLLFNRIKHPVFLKWVYRLRSIWTLNKMLIYLFFKGIKRSAFLKWFTKLCLKVNMMSSQIKQKYSHIFTKNYLKISIKEYFTNTYWWRTVLVLIFYSIAHFCVTYIKKCINLYMAGTESVHWNSLVNLCLHISIVLEILVWILNGILIYLLIKRFKDSAFSKWLTKLRLRINKIFSWIKQKYYHVFTKNYFKIFIKKFKKNNNNSNENNDENKNKKN